VFIVETLRSGGKERRLLHLANELGKRSYSVTVLVLSREIFYSMDGLHSNVVLLKNEMESNRIAFLYKHLVTLIESVRVFCWGNYPALLVAPLGLTGLCRIYNCLITNINPKDALGHKVTFLYSHYIIANSLAGAKAYGVVSNRRLRVIHNGVYPRRIVGKGSLVAPPYNFVMLASYSEKKAHFELINAVSSFPIELRRMIRINFYGDGDFGELSAMLKVLGLREFIGLNEKVSDVDAVLSKADYGVLATYGEGISNFILEAQAHGLPVIASGFGGVNEVIIEGVNGCLVETNSAQDWRQGFSRILSYDYRRLSKNSIKNTKDNFSMDEMIESYLQIL